MQSDVLTEVGTLRNCGSSGRLSSVILSSTKQGWALVRHRSPVEQQQLLQQLAGQAPW